jgi:hypothetical protein
VSVCLFVRPHISFLNLFHGTRGRPTIKLFGEFNFDEYRSVVIPALHEAKFDNY